MWLGSQICYEEIPDRAVIVIITKQADRAEKRTNVMDMTRFRSYRKLLSVTAKVITASRLNR